MPNSLMIFFSFQFRETPFPAGLERGHPFSLLVDYDPADFKFNIWLGESQLGYRLTRDDLPDITLKSVTVEGSLDIDYVGFKREGLYSTEGGKYEETHS